ncbi:restriction endonuclease subunit S [Xanthomonas cannabis]|uniref:restriction endonuclease subunit S n=1 Tax=Xanthomonas cannabis TaxID=1885674 RepID=UPI0033AACCAD
MTALLTHNLPMLAGAPNGIKKLRELILELAVRGKLVPQDANDEPASELLKRIVEEKARLVAEGGIKKQKPLAGIGEEEKPFELPLSWEWRRISELLPEFQNGASSRGDSNGLPVTVLRLADIRAGEISLDDTRTLLLSVTTVRKYKLEDGDILLIRVNGSADLVGRFVVCRANLQAIPCDHFIRMRFPRNLVDSAYLKLFGDSDIARSAIARLFVSTAGQKTVNQGHIGSLSVPLPPLAEQRRIVAKVDELMALCDRLDARQADADSAHAQLVQALLDSLTHARDSEDFAQSWQRLAEHFHTLFTTESSIDALKQTLLQLAVMGKLVPQDPSDEPASELLQRIEEEKMRLVAAGKLKKQKPLEGISSTETPFEIPSSWAWSKIGVIALSTEYGLSEKTSNLQDGAPVLKMGDVQGGKVLLGGQMKVSKKTAGLPELYLEPEDLLYNRTNSAELVGKTGIFLGQSGEYTFASYLIRIRCSKGLFSPFYLNASMNSPGFRETQIQPYLKQQCGQANVNGTIMKSMMVSVPPLAEQHRIVAKLDQLMVLCDQLKSRLSEARQVNEHLANALIDQALNNDKKSRAEAVDFSAYLISKLASQRTFGRVAHMKLLFLADCHLGLGLMDGYRRHAAGPLDTTIYRVEQRAAQERLYSTSIEVLKSGQEKVSYHIGANISRSVETAASALGAAQKELDRLIALFEGRKTDDLEAVATLYAVWNDALAGGLHPNDEWLINEFRGNWHEAKERFTPDILGKWLGWMRDHGLVPTGNSAVTKSQAAFLFN